MFEYDWGLCEEVGWDLYNIIELEIGKTCGGNIFFKWTIPVLGINPVSSTLHFTNIYETDT